MSRILALSLALGGLLACTPVDEKSDPNAHCGELTADEVWGAGTHTVTCDVKVDGAQLLIDPGAVVLFEDDASLRVGCEGTGLASLIVAGTEDEPVLLGASSGLPGQWNYVMLCAGNDGEVSALRHADIQGAGSYDNLTAPASLVVRGTEVLVEQVSLYDGVGRGLTLDEGGRLRGGSAGLSIFDHEDEAAHVSAASAGSLPGDGSYVGNGEDVVRVYGGWIAEDDAWAALGVPYVLEGSVMVGGEGEASATLSLSPGVDLRFEGSRALYVGAEERAGGLIAVGTAEAPVRMSGSGNPDPGHWEGLRIEGAALDSSQVEHAEIGFATDGISVTDAAPTLDHVTLHDNLYCGLELSGDATPSVGEGMRYASNGEDICE